MISRWMRAVALLALVPATALASFEVVDSLPFPSRGGFPEAYPRDPIYPMHIWGQVGIMAHSNPFGLPDGADVPASLGGESEQSDAIMRYGVGIVYTQRVVGRQSVRLHARGEYYDYLRFNELDNFGYDVGGDWLWEIGNNLGGTIGYERSHGLADLREVQRAAPDDVTNDLFYANGAYRFHPNWRLRAGAEHTIGKREGTREDVDTEATTVRAGLDYVSGLGNAIGVEVRETRGDAPVTGLLDPTGTLRNRYTEEEVALVLTYNLGTQLIVGGRLGNTKRHYEELPIPDFDGPTGRLRADWRASPKVSLVFEAAKELRPLLDVDATHVLVESFSFGPSWAPVMKLVFTARFVTERRQYQSTIDTGLPLRDDTLEVISLGAGWEPVRHFTVGASVEHGTRRSNTLGRDYDYNSATVNVRYDW
jgi:hypothetical protein